jgi:hypothetical protein
MWKGAEGMNDMVGASDRGKPSDWFPALSLLVAPFIPIWEFRKDKAVR